MKIIFITGILIFCFASFANCKPENSKNTLKYPEDDSGSKIDTVNNPNENCQFCKWLVNNYKWGINDSLTVKKVQKPFLRSCDIFNEPIKSRCLTFYLGSGTDLIKAILNKENTVKICQMVNLCDKSNGKNVYQTFIKIMMKSSTPPDFYNCKMCTKHINFLEISINKSKSPGNVLNNLKGICEIFKTFQKQNCKIYYDQVGINIIKALLINEKPKSVCKILNYCKKVNFVQDNKSKLMSTSPSNSCKTCTAIISQYELMINNVLPPVEVQKIFLRICEIFRSPLKDQCILFYRGIGYEVIKAILNREDPAEVCKILHLCLNKNEKSQYNTFLDITISLKSLSISDSCNSCISVITWYENNFNSSKTPEEVQHLLLHGCELYKCPYHDLCVNFYTGIGYELIKDILKKVNPRTICQYLHYCPANQIKQRNLKINWLYGNQEFLSKTTYHSN